MLPPGRWRWLTAAGGALVLFVGLLVLALAHSGPQKTATATAAPTISGSASADRVPPVSLQSVDGTTVRLPAARPGALLFATAGCSSCAASAQALGKVKEGFGSKIDAAFISIDPNDPPSAVRALRSSVGNPPYPFVIDSTGTLYRQYQVSALGTAIVYDAQGQIVARLIEPDSGQWEAALRKAGAA